MPTREEVNAQLRAAGEESRAAQDACNALIAEKAAFLESIRPRIEAAAKERDRLGARYRELLETLVVEPD